ncbi:MAG: cyclic nucleotide-binding domain-containing protein [Candidatus Lindowbacteria bacterium]|nr:cyclic nucleotide-binding domain-containing protein [Candidatus Lindowbacteria bacterium]
MSETNQTLTFSSGERIITEGETSRIVYILVSGELTVWRGSTELGKLTGRGDMIGELAALTGQPRAPTVVAAVDCEVLAIDFDAREVYRKNPEIIEKIADAIEHRFQIARDKIKLYTASTAIGRRSVLQNAAVDREILNNPKLRDTEAQLRKKTRRQLEEDLEMHGDSDNPRIVKQLADQYGVLDAYNSEIESSPWLDQKLIEDFEDLRDRYALSSRVDLVSSIRERATITVDTLDLLGQYESLPGIRREMELQKFERIIPFSTRVDSLRSLGLRRAQENFEEMSERDQRYYDRKVYELVEKEKVNAGSDLVMLIKAAASLKVADEYEAELRKLSNLSNTDSTLFELAI